MGTGLLSIALRFGTHAKASRRQVTVWSTPWRLMFAFLCLLLLAPASAFASTVFGYVLDENNVGIGGVSVSAYYVEYPLTRFNVTTMASGANKGKWVISNASVKGTLRITPSKSGLTFTPTYQNRSVSGSSTESIQVAVFRKYVQPVSISGEIHGDGAVGTYVDLLDSKGKKIDWEVAGANGYYRFSGIAAGRYTVRPNPPAGKTCVPASITRDITSPTTLPPFQLDGSDPVLSIYTKDSDGSDLPNVRVVVSWSSGQVSTTTNGSGYSSVKLTAGISCTIRAMKSGYSDGTVGSFLLTGSIDKTVTLGRNDVITGFAPVRIDPQMAPDGLTANTVVQIHNLGQTSVGGFSVHIYASQDSNSSISGGDIQLGTIGVPSADIPGGQDRIYNGSFSVSALQQGQDYYVKASADETPRVYPQDDSSDNICVSNTQVTVEAPPTPVTRWLKQSEGTNARFKLDGAFQGAETGATYIVKRGSTINDLIPVPADVYAYTEYGAPGSERLSWDPTASGTGFLIRTSGIDGLNELDLLRDFPRPTVSIRESDGRVSELDGLIGRTFTLPPNFAVEITDLSVPKYTENNGGGVQAGVTFAFPLSKTAMKTLSKVDPKIFDPRKTNDWVYLDTMALVRSDSFSASFDLTGEWKLFNGALKVPQFHGAIETKPGNKYVDLNGTVELTRICGGTTITLNRLYLVDYFHPDIFDVLIQTGQVLPVVPVPNVPNAYILGFDKLHVAAENMYKDPDNLVLNGGVGLVLGYFVIPQQGNIRAIDVDTEGYLKPAEGDFGIEGNVKMFVYTGAPKDFEGFDLLSAKFDYDSAPRLMTGHADLNLLNIVTDAHGDFSFWRDTNYFKGIGRGVVRVPTWMRWLAGDNLNVSLGVTSGKKESVRLEDGPKVFGTIKSENTGNHGGIGFHFIPALGWDGLDIGGNLYDDYAKHKNGAAKDGGVETISISGDHEFAILSILFETGDTDATLDAPWGGHYGPADTLSELNSGQPVHYKKNVGVRADGVTVTEICFFLKPEAGNDTVTQGSYTVTLTNPGSVGPYQVRCFLPYDSPTITLSEPSSDVDVNPLAPQPVNIQFAGDAPSAQGDADVLLYFDSDNQGYDGQPITYTQIGQLTPGYVGPSPITIADAPYAWDTTGLPSGDYYVYASIDDGFNPPVYSNYSSGKVSVTNPLAPPKPSNLLAAAAQNSVLCSWNSSATDNTQYAIFYDTNSVDSSLPYENKLSSESNTSWRVDGLEYGHTYRFAVAAFNPDSMMYSRLEGPVTVDVYSTTANNAPAIMSSPVTEGRVGYPYEYKVEATDIDGDQLLFQLVPKTVEGHPELISPPAGITIGADTGIIAFTPVEGHLGSNRVEVMVSDGKGGSDTQEFYINIDNWMSPNADPVFDSTPTLSVEVGEIFEYDANAGDEDGDQVTYSLSQAPAGMTIDNGTGLVRWATTTSDFGFHPVVVQASDGRGGVAEQSFTLDVVYPALSGAIVVSPDTPQPAGTVITFTADAGKYATSVHWDFGDGTSADGVTAKHTYDNLTTSDIVRTVMLTIQGPNGLILSDAVNLQATVTVRPQAPSADFTIDTNSGVSPLSANFTNTSQGVVTSWAWNFGDGSPEESTQNASHTFNSLILQDYWVTLTATGPSGTSTCKKVVSIYEDAALWQSIFEENFNGTFDHAWRKVTSADLAAGPSEAVSSDFSLVNGATDIEIQNNNQQGHALAVSPDVSLGNKAFRFTVWPTMHRELHTVAGGGNPGDGPYKLQACFWSPVGVGVGPDGSVFVADNANQRIRRIAPTGAISTVAGIGCENYRPDYVALSKDNPTAPATSIYIPFPSELDVDGSGNVYFTYDTGAGSLVAKLSSDFTTATLIAGGGADTADGTAVLDFNFGNISSLAVNPGGDKVYVVNGTSGSECTIRLIENGLVTSIIGTGTVGTWTSGQIAKGQSCGIIQQGLQVLSNGDLYFLEDGGQIGKVDSAGVVAGIATVSGVGHKSSLVIDEHSPTKYYYKPGIPAIYKYESGGDSLYTGDATEGLVDGTVSNARFSDNLQMATDASGNLFVSDMSNRRVRRIDTSSNVTTTYAGGYPVGDGLDALDGSLYCSPGAIAMDDSDNLYIGELGGYIWKVNSGTSVLTKIAGKGILSRQLANGGALVPAADATFYIGGGLVTSGDGSTQQFIAQTSLGTWTGRILQLSNNEVSVVAGSDTYATYIDMQAPLSVWMQPTGLARDDQGHLYYSDSENHVVAKIDFGTNKVDLVAGLLPAPSPGFSGDGGPATSAQLNRPRDVYWRPNRTLIADGSNARIRAVNNLDGSISTVVNGSPDNLSDTMSVAEDEYGNIYYEWWSGLDLGRLIKKRPDGTVSQLTKNARNIDFYEGEDARRTCIRSHGQSDMLAREGWLYVVNSPRGRVLKLWIDYPDHEWLLHISQNQYMRLVYKERTLKVYEVVNGVVTEVQSFDIDVLPEDSVTLYGGIDGSDFRYTLLVNDSLIGSWIGTSVSGTARLGVGQVEDYSNRSRTADWDKCEVRVYNEAPVMDSPPTVPGTPDFTIGVEGSVCIHLDDYVEDDLTPDDGLVWSFGDSGDPQPVQGFDLSFDTVNRVLCLAAQPGFTGTVPVTVSALDAGGRSTSQTFQITVTSEPSTLFSDVAGSEGILASSNPGVGATLADLTGDELPDLGIAREGTTPGLLTKVGDSYADEGMARGLDAPPNALSQSSADFDNDGFVDAVYVYADKTRLYRNDGTGHFVDVTPANLVAVSGNSAIWSDVDKDGDVDLYFVRAGANRLFLNQLKETSVPTFVESISSGLEDLGNGEAAVFADIDLDGDPDCYVCNKGGSSALYRNMGAGLFVQDGASGAEIVGNSYGAVFADFTNDSYPDLYVACDGADHLFVNTGAGSFVDASAAAGISNPMSGRSVQAIDYDNDGWIDIYVSNYESINMLYRNNGNGTFTDADALPGVTSGVRGAATGSGMGVASGDIDGDGDIDLWQVNSNGEPPNLFQNNWATAQSSPDRNWIELKLVGSDSNRSAIGARIELWHNGSIWQTREVSGGSGWHSQNSLVQHIGLGLEDIIEELRVYWSSGNVTERTYESVNQTLEITEEREITAIQLAPERATVTPGETVEFAADGVYANGDHVSLPASELYWETADPAVAYVDESGTVLGISDGVTYLTARKGDLESYKSEIIVSEKKATALVVVPIAAVASVGENQPFTATVQYDDATSEDVTTSVDWFTSEPSVATVGRSGTARAIGEGSTLLHAEYLGLTSNEAQLDVAAMTPQLTLAPVGLMRRYSESEAQQSPFTVHRTYQGYSDPAVDVTGQVTWISTDPLVAWVDSKGNFWTSHAGTTQLKAKSGSAESNSVTVDVRDHLGLTTELPDSVSAFVGDDVTLRIEHQGGFDPISIQWYKDDGSKALVPIGDNSNTLALPQVQMADEGTYVVQVSDGNTDSKTDSTVLTIAKGLPAAGAIGLALISLFVATVGVFASNRKN